MKKTLLPVSLLGLLVLGAVILIQRGKNDIRQLRTQYETEIERLEAANQSQAEQDLAKHRKLMEDNELISGNRARQSHEQEWNRRTEFDPAFARTKREKTILDIVALSKQESLPAQELLQRVAILSAPKESSVDVTPTQGGFRVAVTFDMSVMTSGEQGSRTKHTSIESLKREVVEIMSHVSKDMYDHCGQKGIATISVACTHGVQQSQFGLSFGGTTVTTTIYQCAISQAKAKKVPDWRRMPLHKVAEMFEVEHDEFPHLRIVTTTTSGFGW